MPLSNSLTCNWQEEEVHGGVRVNGEVKKHLLGHFTRKNIYYGIGPFLYQRDPPSLQLFLPLILNLLFPLKKVLNQYLIVYRAVEVGQPIVHLLLVRMDHFLYHCLYLVTMHGKWRVGDTNESKASHTVAESTGCHSWSQGQNVHSAPFV